MRSLSKRRSARRAYARNRSLAFERCEPRRLLASLTINIPQPRVDSPTEISFNFGPGMRQHPAARAALERAADQWRSRLNDDVHLTFDVDFGDGPNAVDEAEPQPDVISYARLRSSLTDDAEADDQIIHSLPKPSDLRFNLPAGASFSSSPSNEGHLRLTRANMKALGMIPRDDPRYLEPDATIRFPDNADFNFDVRNGIAANQIDFEAVAAHEIGHALGFVSSLDTPPVDGVVQPTPLDLFRFAEAIETFNPSGPDDFANFSRELRPNVRTVADFVFASWTGTAEFPFERGEGSGGQQPSHWLDNDLSQRPIGIMDPVLQPGEIGRVSLADLRALDLIGWDVDPPAGFAPASPPPTSAPFVAEDVNADGNVAPLDALIVINILNRGSTWGTNQSAAEGEWHPSRTDVNGDGRTTPVDALRIINRLNRDAHAGSGEQQAEAAAIAATDIYLGFPGLPVPKSADDELDALVDLLSDY